MKKFSLFFVLLLTLAACGGGESETLPTPLPPTPVAQEPPTAVPATETAAPPPAPPTLPPIPTNTPAAPLPTDGVVLQTLADFGTDRNPLTGELVEDKSLLQKRPLAIKLSNSPPIYTRPQSGLNDADWIYEHTTEGAITRFTAIFYGKLPPRVGPIRSARLIDLELPAMYDAALAFSGASNGVLGRLSQVDFNSRILYSNEPGYYRTGEDKPLEHTLYGDPLKFHEALATKGLDVAPTFTTVNAFSSQPPAGGQPASELRVDYDWTVIDWRYDAASGEYLRWADGEIHADGNSGEQVAVANVVIVTPNHQEDGEICEEVQNGVCAHLSMQIQLWGSGAAAVFRDGQQYNVTWQRQGRNDSLTFTDSAGNPFPLQIGNSWVQVVPNWLTNPVTVTP